MLGFIPQKVTSSLALHPPVAFKCSTLQWLYWFFLAQNGSKATQGEGENQLSRLDGRISGGLDRSNTLAWTRITLMCKQNNKRPQRVFASQKPPTVNNVFGTKNSYDSRPLIRSNPISPLPSPGDLWDPPFPSEFVLRNEGLEPQTPATPAPAFTEARLLKLLCLCPVSFFLEPETLVCFSFKPKDPGLVDFGPPAKLPGFPVDSLGDSSQNPFFDLGCSDESRGSKCSSALLYRSGLHSLPWKTSHMFFAECQKERKE